MSFTSKKLIKIREEGRRLFDFESGIHRTFSLLNLIVFIGLLVFLFSNRFAGQTFISYTALGIIACFLVMNYVQQAVLVRIRRKWYQLEQESIHDGLTQALNRSYFDEVLEDEMSRARRYGIPLSVCLLDIDNFKTYNDTHGHLKGDELLKDFARHIQGAIRSSDALARYGGDEFVVLLPHTDLISAEKFLARLLIGVQEWLDISFSAGITSSAPREDKAAFLARADLALYQAKREGKNRIRCMIGEDGTQAILHF